MESKFHDLWAAGLAPAHLKTGPITNYIASLGNSNLLLVTSAIGLTIAAIFITRSPVVLSTIFNAFLHYTNIIRSIDNKGLLKGPTFSYPFGNSKERLFQSRKYSFDWAQQYGKIYRIWTGLHSEVVITTPEDVAKFYQDANSHNKTFHRRSGWVTNSVLGEAVGFVSGNRWRVFRKILDPLVSNSVAVKHIPRINRAGLEFVASIPNVRIDKGGANDPLIISAARTFMPFPLLETSRVFFGEMEDTEKAELLEIGGIYSKALLLLFENGPFRRWLGYWMHTPTEYKATKEFLNRWDLFNGKIAQERQDKNDLPITQLWKHVHQGTITHKELIQTITEMTYTNLDVTSHVITTTCLFLADNRGAQDALVAEIDLHRNDIEKYLGRKDTLLHYAFLEAMRLQPVLPFTLPEASITDKELGGYHIPKHTSVTTDSYGLNIRNPFWGPNATEYQPMRFETISPIELIRNMNAFGYGSRKCLGQYFADKQLRSLVMHLFDKYDVSWHNRSQTDAAFETDKSAHVEVFNVELCLIQRARTDVKDSHAGL